MSGTHVHLGDVPRAAAIAVDLLICSFHPRTALFTLTTTHTTRTQEAKGAAQTCRRPPPRREEGEAAAAAIVAGFRRPLPRVKVSFLGQRGMERCRTRQAAFQGTVAPL